MKKYQDIHNSDLTLKAQFSQAWLNGNYTSAFNILQNNPQLDSKAFVASCFANIVDALNVLEGYFYNGVTEEMQLLFTNYTEGINQFVNRKQWDNTKDYKVGNFVIYDDEIYLCIQDNTNILPINTAYWSYLGLVGEKGNNAVQTDFRYNWTSSDSYDTNSVVMYDKNLYYALRHNINKTPTTNPQDWAIFISIPQVKIVVSSTTPSDDLVYDGLIWWQIIN